MPSSMATIVPMLSYRAADLEGHRWMFSQHLQDVKPEDWGAVTA